MKQFGIRTLISLLIVFSIPFFVGAMGNMPGEKAETLTLLRNLSEEPLAADATRDVPPNIDETQISCLTHTGTAGQTANVTPSSGQPRSDGGVQ